MIKIDLITGFLGSGKTTFLKKYVRYCMEQGENLCILENDFGAVNVDTMLLQDILGEKCNLEMVAGGCDKDCHVRRFKTKLIAMGMCGYDRVIVEPSGIFDMDEFFDVLREDPLERWYAIDNIITIVDAFLPKKLSEASDYILASQVANAGTIIFSKTQEIAESENDQTEENRKMEIIAHMKNSLDKIHGNSLAYLGLEHILWKDWKDFTDYDFQYIQNGGYHAASYVKRSDVEEECFRSLYFMHVSVSREMLQKKITGLFEKNQFGHVIRVKGFIKNEAEEWLEINAVKNKIQILPITKGQEVIIVIGENLNQTKLEQYWDD